MIAGLCWSPILYLPGVCPGSPGVLQVHVKSPQIFVALTLRLPDAEERSLEQYIERAELEDSRYGWSMLEHVGAESETRLTVGWPSSSRIVITVSGFTQTYMNHAFTLCCDIVHVILLIMFHSLKPLGWLAFSWCFAHLRWCFFVLFHFRAAFTMGEKVGVTFPSSWGA